MTSMNELLTKTEREAISYEIDWQENRWDDDSCQPDQLDEFSIGELLEYVYVAMDSANTDSYNIFASAADKLEEAC